MSTAIAATVVPRLAMESFLPSGRTEHDAHLPNHGLGSDSSSVISPLALPRGVVGYFDHLSVTSHPHPIATQRSKDNGTIGKPHHVYSPRSSLRSPPQPQPAHFLSPRVTPTTQQVSYEPQQRSSSLSPTRLEAATVADRSHSGMVAFSTSPRVFCSGQSRLGSGLADSTSSASQAHMVERLVQQNERMRCAWEAERKYLEVNRERAEEVYKEERALMEEERAAWDAERSALLEEIEQLQQQVLAFQDGDRTFARHGGQVLGQHISSDGVQEIALLNGLKSSQSSKRDKRPRKRDAGRTGGGLAPLETGSAPGVFRPNTVAVAPPRTEFGLPGQARSAFSKSQGPPSLIPPTANNIAARASLITTALMESADDEETGPVPVVDIQEIHPELEGIPIKATTIHKATFTDDPSFAGSGASSSRLPSPPNANRPALPKRISAEQTLQVLQVDESRRLVMHAGHTPNHSISLVPTSVPSGASTSSSSGEQTPQVHPIDATEHWIADFAPDDKGKAPVRRSRTRAPETSETVEDFSMDHPEPHLQPTEDRELRGPLMVRNMPAHDEIFFRKLSDKLEEVKKSPEGILPAVLREAAQAGEASRDAEAQPGADGANGAGDDAESNPGSNDEEIEVPLKLKRSNNFGAPFGERR